MGEGVDLSVYDGAVSKGKKTSMVIKGKRIVGWEYQGYFYAIVGIYAQRFRVQ